MEQLRVLLISILFTVTINCSTIAQGFSGGIGAGFTMSQIDGDVSRGFHKFGGAIQGFVDYSIGMHCHSFELSAMQKGATNNDGSYRISLTYLDATYLYQIQPSALSEIFPENLRLAIGADLGVLAKEKSEYNSIEQNKGSFDKFDIQGVAGASFLIGRYDISIRGSYSIAPINHQYYNFCIYALFRYSIVGRQ